MEYTYEYFQKIADFLKTKVDYTPEIAIILGSCLGPFAEQIENPVVVDYKDIPDFLVSTAPSHAGKMIFGTICGRKVVCMSGRFHTYEGYSYNSWLFLSACSSCSESRLPSLRMPPAP